MASCGDEFTFTWKIENFSCLPQQQGDKLVSAEFIVESVMKSKWCLHLYPSGYNGDENGCKDHISLFLCNLEQIPLTVYHYIALETTEGFLEIPDSSECMKTTFTSNNPRGVFIIPLSTLYENKYLYLPQDVMTIIYSIRPFDENYEIPNNTKTTVVPYPFRIQSLSVTRIKVQRKSLTWHITKIRKIVNNKRKTIVSVNSAITETPSLELAFSISEDSNEEYAQIEILATHSPCEYMRLFVKCKIEILTADKICRNSMEDTHLFSMELDDKWIFPAFVKTKDLTDEKYIYVDDTLLLQCDFSFTYPGTEYHVEAPQYAPCLLEIEKPTTENRLCDSIHHLYSSGGLCDVTLRADGKTFPAHRLVLCARSPVFSAMFENDMTEKDTNVVDVADVDAETLEMFLKYLHSDTVDEELTPEEVSNLYEAADKYQVDVLKRKCSISLASTLCVSSVCDVMILADAHQDDFLMSAVHNFLRCHSSEVFNCEDWKEFMDFYPKLSGMVMLQAWKSKPFL